MVMKYDELSRDEGSTNSSRLRIRLQKANECQNSMEIASKCKEMEEIHDTSSSRNLFKMKCLFILSELAYKYCGLFTKV
jgi:hypothetical protein